jgi:hypothetical protein
MPRHRYQIRKARSGWYVYDTHTGTTWPGELAPQRRTAAPCNRERLSARSPRNYSSSSFGIGLCV